MFRSYQEGREDYVTILANYNPLQDSYGGPNYFALSDSHFYEIYIDNDGDLEEDLTFQFLNGYTLGNNNKGLTVRVGDQDVAVPLKFIAPITRDDTSGLNFFEYYHLNLIEGDRTKSSGKPIKNKRTGGNRFSKPFDYAGRKSFPNYSEYASSFIYEIEIPKCDKPGKVFVGQRREPFSVNLGRIFDLVSFVPVDSETFPGGIKQNVTNNIVRTKNIDTFALEIPTSCLVGKGDGVIAGWTAVRTMRHNSRGEHVALEQTNRVANPLVNEVVIGLKDKNDFNLGSPKNDAKFLTYVTHPTLPELLNILFRDAVNSILEASFTTLAPTNIPRNDLVAVFLTGIQGLNKPRNGKAGEVMRLNTTIPPKKAEDQHPMGVIGGDASGYPNGRRPGDDVVDISLRVVMGRLCHLNLGFCSPTDANVGMADFTDGAPISATDFQEVFPYFRPPVPGAY